MDFNFPEKKGTGALGLRKNGWRYDLPSGDVKIAIENDHFSWENPLLMVWKWPLIVDFPIKNGSFP